jgi:hypothetical protein
MPLGIAGLGERKGRGEGPQESHVLPQGNDGSSLGRPDGNRSMPIARLGNTVDEAQ